MAEPQINDFHVDEDLEDIFHRQLKILDLENNATSHSDIVGDHLPEWLIGVIIVVIMLIIAFFAMVVTSVSKKRNSVKGDNSANPYDDLESGAVTANGNGETLQVTSFVYSNDATAQENNADFVSPSPDTSMTCGNNDSEELKCYKNPLFVEDEEELINQNVDPDKAVETQKRNEPDRVHNSPGYKYGEVSPCSNKSLSSETDQIESARSHIDDGSARSGKSTGSLYRQKRFSSLTDTRREISTEAVVENSIELDHGSVQRRKKLSTASIADQAEEMASEVRKSSTPEQDNILEGKKDNQRVESPVEKHQYHSLNQLKISASDTCCSDSGVEVSTVSSLRSGKRRNQKDMDANIQVHEINGRDANGKDSNTASTVNTYPNSLNSKQDRTCLEIFEQNSTKANETVEVDDVVAEKSLSQTANGMNLIISTTGEESRESINSSERTKGMNITGGLNGSNQNQHHAGSERTRETPEEGLCHDEEVCEDGHWDFHRNKPINGDPASIAISGFDEVHEEDFSQRPLNGSSSLAKNDLGMKGKAVDVRSSVEQHYSTNL